MGCWPSRRSPRWPRAATTSSKGRITFTSLGVPPHAGGPDARRRACAAGAAEVELRVGGGETGVARHYQPRSTKATPAPFSRVPPRSPRRPPRAPEGLTRCARGPARGARREGAATASSMRRPRGPRPGSCGSAGAFRDHDRAEHRPDAQPSCGQRTRAATGARGAQGRCRRAIGLARGGGAVSPFTGAGQTAPDQRRASPRYCW